VKPGLSLNHRLGKHDLPHTGPVTRFLNRRYSFPRRAHAETDKKLEYVFDEFEM
jgi:hypothetical protein